jgi:hypothetical protein
MHGVFYCFIAAPFVYFRIALQIQARNTGVGDINIFTAVIIAVIQ